MNKIVRKLQKRFLKYFLPVVFLFTVLPVKNLCATGAMWQAIDYKSRIFINFCSNADRFSHDILFEYRHEIEALDYVKNVLVKEKKIKDIPILIILPRDFPGWGPGSEVWIKPPGVQGGIQISIESNGLLLQDEEDFSKIGPCYAIYIPGQKESYEKLLILTLALQFLTPETEKIEVSNISELKKSLEQDLAKFSNISRHFDPVSSPVGQSVVYAAWHNGLVDFELVSPASKAGRKLEPLEGYMASLPLWSPDSRYLAYASLQEIKVFDSRTNRTATIPVLELLRSNHKEITAIGEVLLSFEKTAGELWFALTPIHRSRWYVWNYNLKNATLIDQDTKPEWGEDIQTAEKYYREIYKILQNSERSNEEETRLNEYTAQGSRIVKNLAKVGSPAVPALIRAMEDKNNDSRFRCWIIPGILREIGDPQATEPLLKLMEEVCTGAKDIDEAGGGSGRILEALSKIGSTNASLLTKNLTDKSKNSFFRCLLASEVVRHMDKKDIVRSLIYIVEDKKENTLVRRGAAQGLGSIKNKEAVEPLLRVIDSTSDKDLKDIIMWSLQNLGSEKAENEQLFVRFFLTGNVNRIAGTNF